MPDAQTTKQFSRIVPADVDITSMIPSMPGLPTDITKAFPSMERWQRDMETWRVQVIMALRGTGVGA